MTFTVEWINANADYSGSNSTTKQMDELTLLESWNSPTNPILYGEKSSILINRDNSLSDDIAYILYQPAFSLKARTLAAIKLNTSTSRIPVTLWNNTFSVDQNCEFLVSDGSYIITDKAVIRTSDGNITDLTRPQFSTWANETYVDQSDFIFTAYYYALPLGVYQISLQKHSLNKTTGGLTSIKDITLAAGAFPTTATLGILFWASGTRISDASDGYGSYRDLFICGYAYNPGFPSGLIGIKAFRDYLSASVPQIIANGSVDDIDAPTYTGVHYFQSPDVGLSPDFIFISTTSKIKAFTYSGGSITDTSQSISVGSGTNGTGAALYGIYNDNPYQPILYYRNGNTIQKVYYDFTTGFQSLASYSLLPNVQGYLVVAYDKIICVSNIADVNNIHVFDLDLNLLDVAIAPNSSSFQTRPSVGSTPYFIVNDNTHGTAADGNVYVYGSFSPTTTTTTTSSTTSTTTLPPTTTTTTTNTNTTPTTTTTTTLSPLQVVETSYFELVNGVYVNRGASDASDNSGTVNTVFAKSPTFGNIAPGQTSDTLVVALRVPYSLAITNIRLGLIETGGVEFSNTTFGITNSVELRDDIEPDAYFQGINSTSSATSAYNITIPNKDSRSSNYVYLNMKLPRDNFVGTGLVSLKWWFDYSS